jgi:hypothetical protein
MRIWKPTSFYHAFPRPLLPYLCLASLGRTVDFWKISIRIIDQSPTRQVRLLCLGSVPQTRAAISVIARKHCSAQGSVFRFCGFFIQRIPTVSINSIIRARRLSVEIPRVRSFGSLLRSDQNVRIERRSIHHSKQTSFDPTSLGQCESPNARCLCCQTRFPVRIACAVNLLHPLPVLSPRKYGMW